MEVRSFWRMCWVCWGGWLEVFGGGLGEERERVASCHKGA